MALFDLKQYRKVLYPVWKLKKMREGSTEQIDTMQPVPLWARIGQAVIVMGAIVVFCILCQGCEITVQAYEPIMPRITNMYIPNCTPLIHHTCSELADAIYTAEGGSHTRHPYGILMHYRHTTPRMACINTIHHQIMNWLNTDQSEPFLAYLARHYAPIGASNDPNNLNINWIYNVQYWLRKG